LDLVNFDKVPGGQNATLAVMSYSAYDIEDAIILNKASLDRGFGRCMVLRKHQTSLRRYPNGAQDENHGPPDPSQFAKGIEDPRYQRYGKLDIDGICMVGEKLDPNQIMVRASVFLFLDRGER
jgi:DNA-directed RNA polymerase III subunit RPC2